MLSARQYGFLKNISMVDALHNVWEYTAKSKRLGVYTYLLTLDIKSAFNHVQKTSMLRFGVVQYNITSWA